MSRSFLLTDDLADYVVAHSRPPDGVLRDLAVETQAMGGIASMQISHEQGALLELLATVTGARSAIEIGTFTGYSSICLARGMGPDGRLLCCDVSEEWTAIARRYWERAGLADRIALRLGPAAETLAGVDGDTTFDLAFVDADKTGYLEYVDLLHARMTPGSLIVVDNTLWSGTVLPPGSNAGAERPEVKVADDPDTLALQTFNDTVARDERFTTVLVPVADGITLLAVR